MQGDPDAPAVRMEGVDKWFDAFQALLRDSARYAVMAVGMTFVIGAKDIDLSVGSTYGLIAGAGLIGLIALRRRAAFKKS